MKLIVITTPHFFAGEAEAITALFHSGLQTLHLRKPSASIAEIEKLLAKLPPQYMGRIVTHEHFCLVSDYHLKGIHLNGRNPHIPENYSGHISCSCHSLDEVAQHKPTCNYVFLSPIYDSISKAGYASAYTHDSLLKACQSQIIDSRVVALGGISAKHFPEIQSLGFGGVAMLGDIWSRTGNDFIEHFQNLRRLSLSY